MAVSLRNPQLVSSLIPVDNAPIDTRLSSSFPIYVQAMKQIERSGITHQREAYAIMNQYEKSIPVQHFLLANLRRNDEHEMKFRIPVDILGKSLNNMGDFPYHPSETRFSNPTLFIRGKNSPYVADEAFPAIGEFFPRFVMRDVDAGHWCKYLFHWITRLSLDYFM